MLRRVILAISLLVLVLLAVWQINTLRPPSSIRLAAGPEGEQEFQTAQRYQTYLQARGVDVEIVPTAGSLQSLELVQSGEVDVGFMLNAANLLIDASAQVAVVEEHAGIVGIAAVAHVPIWIFYHSELQGDTAFDELADLRGLRVSLDEPQSGTRALASFLLGLSDLTLADFTVVDATPEQSKEMLLNGDIDAMFLASGVNSQNVRDLLQAPGVEVLNLRLAATYERMVPILHKVDLLEGSISISELTPPTDKHLLTIASVLVAKEDFHPDLQLLLLRAAKETQGGVLDLFASGEVFPAVNHLTVPTSKISRQYIGEGQTFLQRYLPFWIASPLERFYLLALPILLLLYPLVRNTPAAYAFFMNRRVNVWYTRIRQIELKLEHYSLDELDTQIKELDELQQQLTETIDVPNGYLSSFYNLRSHILLVLVRLRERKAVLQANPPDTNIAHE